MDPTEYIYTEQTALLEEKCVAYHFLELKLAFCQENKRQPTDDESDDIQTPVWDPDTYGAGILESLKSEIGSAGTAAEADALIDRMENAVDKDIANIENDIDGYPSA